MHDEYQIVGTIGSGAFGQVFLVKSLRDSQLYAMKKIHHKKQQIDVESQILPKLSHPNIITIKHIITENNETLLFLQYASGGDLSEYVKKHYSNKKIEPKIIINWLLQLCLGLNYLHNDIRIIHRDIKMKNVLVMENQILKLADFGVSRKLQIGEEFALTSVGTPEYLSPQIINLGKYDTKTDVWGLGCIMFELCNGHKPFKATVLNQLIKNIINHDCGDIPSIYPEWLQQVIKGMLEKNPDNRLSIQQILERPQLKEQFLSLKERHKEYKHMIYPIRSIRTTKHLQKDDRIIKLFTQSLKTVKNEKSNKIGIEPQTILKKQHSVIIKKVQRDKYLNRSLRSIIDKRKQQKS